MGWLRNHDVQFEPFASDRDWPGELVRGQMSSQFKADFPQTLDLLDRELSCVAANTVVLQTFHHPRDIRVDGMPRAQGSPRHPGVVLRFESKKLPLAFPCQKFAQWTENVRAITLSLEALRQVNRYGIVTNNEQYRGWLALPPPMSPGDELKNAQDALAFLRRLVSAFAAGQCDTTEALRKAQFLTHPDKGGDPDDFKRVCKCERLLGLRA